ncbi:zinc-ribbon domain-containing protein [Limimaricola pyoseonensis]|uniref:MJ0042 family finger-like domain-containing protein n=1 Tax=Limimaricola pyoseonensis TaxID=521013 RepID=A0A1G7JYD7_9RHOB|nr:zinc-ribbon domain-containing protein [Limimaricola pyoseonensis]SDF29943.1 MJ0042 family finger-like domain-containing protein [Limimaricola pyoseonensis]
MRLICPNCGAQYEVDEEAVPEEGREVQCSDCGLTWLARREAPGAPADDPAPEGPEGAAPAPDEVEAEDEDEDEAAAAPPPMPRRRTITPEIEEILRAEAEREEAQRRAEAGLRRRDAPDRDEAEETAPDERHDPPPPDAEAAAEPEADDTRTLKPDDNDPRAAPSGAPSVEETAEETVETRPAPEHAAEPDAPEASIFGEDDLSGEEAENAALARALRSEPEAEPLPAAPLPPEREREREREPELETDAARGFGAEAPAEPEEEAWAAPPSERVTEADAVTAEPPQDELPPDEIAEIERHEAPEAMAARDEVEAPEEDAARARARAAAASTGAVSRRDLLPDIEEINSTLRGTALKSGGVLRPVQDDGDGSRARGFRLGFAAAMLLATVLALVYAHAGRLAEMMPVLAEPLAAYADWVDTGRVWLDDRLQALLLRIS